MTFLILCAACRVGPNGDLPTRLTLEGPQDQNPGDSPPRLERQDLEMPRDSSTAFIALDRLEAEAFIGIPAEGGSDLGGGLLLRAPLPWLSPRAPTDQNDLGLFVQIQFGAGNGDSVDLAFGLDYALVQSYRWRLAVQAAAHLTSVGTTSFSESVGPLLGIDGGFRISPHIWIMLNPQVTYHRDAGWKETNLVGAMISF